RGSVARDGGEELLGHEARQDDGPAAAQPQRQHEHPTGVDEARRVEHGVVGRGREEVEQHVPADRRVRRLGVLRRLPGPGGAGRVELTLFEEFQAGQQERTREAINAVREAGETDPMRQFIAGAGAYLNGCLEERDVARLFISGDGPPGFDRVMRERLNKWARRNAALFHTADGGVDEALVVVLTGAMAGAVSEISLLDDEEAARNLAAEIMSIVGTIRNPRTEQR